MFDADDTAIRDSAALAVLLAWYREMGVDEAVAGSPTDWLEHGPSAPGAVLRERLADQGAVTAAATVAPQGAAPLRPPPPAVMRPAGAALQPASASRAVAPAARSFPSAPPDVSQVAARSAAASAQSLASLEAALRAFDGCGLKATAKNLCFFRGAERAKVMLIGEAPGRDEDLEGKPFVGPAGKLLDRMLASIGLSDAEVHITNIVYWRPPGNRTPTPQEATVCRPFLDRQIALVEPDILVPLGGAAAKHVLNVAEGIMRLRGRWQTGEFGGRPIRILPTLHPAYLLRTPAAKRLAWRDLLALKAVL